VHQINVLRDKVTGQSKGRTQVALVPDWLRLSVSNKAQLLSIHLQGVFVALLNLYSVFII
jgi:hypothetical protein